ncbi:MAG TPA: UDP-N-acetylmuramoyl-tripeptide--D-alanyl-D-alanine ligase [Gaiellales bacterium]|nr:UDP-N-acetylmuramoyl-tripeptide--D-alanyl-D-alanine ligase [Gaiellales bacterium]
MIRLSAREIAAVTGGTASGPDAAVTGVAIDSRAVAPGDLFAALPGERTHGSRFAEAALRAGAAALMLERETPVPDATVSAVRVDSAVAALGAVAAEVRRRSPARVVAITGSTGKTSTKDILGAILGARFTTIVSHANYNNEIGLPLTLCRIEPDTQAVVCELGMRGAGQIAYLTRIAAPDVGVITSVGPVHLELMGTVEAVAAAKAEILELGPGAAAVVPYAEPLLAPHLAGREGRLVTFGEPEGADVRLVKIGRGRAEIAHRGRTLIVPVSFDQRHNGVNLAAAVAACDALGVAIDDSLLAGAAAAEISRWRGERLPLPGGGVLIADCYNANPVSMSAALDDLVAVADGRRTVAVLGDMAELGGTAEGYHAAVGRELADLGIDEVIAIGPLSRGYGGTWYATLEEALEAVPAAIRPGDAVLVKASRAMGLEAVVEAVTR